MPGDGRPWIFLEADMRTHKWNIYNATSSPKHGARLAAINADIDDAYSQIDRVRKRIDIPPRYGPAAKSGSRKWCRYASLSLVKSFRADGMLDLSQETKSAVGVAVGVAAPLGLAFAVTGGTVINRFRQSRRMRQLRASSPEEQRPAVAMGSPAERESPERPVEIEMQTQGSRQGSPTRTGEEQRPFSPRLDLSREARHKAEVPWLERVD